MAERGSSSRKRGRGVKWRQVFHDKPYNPPLLLYFSYFSSLLRLVHREYSKLAHKQTLVSHFSLFCNLLLFDVIRPPYPSDLICPPQIAPLSFNPRFLFTVSSVCCPKCCKTTWLCGFEIVSNSLCFKHMDGFPTIPLCLT